ncbi:MAG: hypothetical protein JO033_03660 [Acidobacteriaceae bacterium]|nr:hypothetical protein [Acidobacteriaceae bacterium]MBV9501827.1 hypothetical protein [Acidobacteriaceae bacterium]
MRKILVILAMQLANPMWTSTRHTINELHQPTTVNQTSFVLNWVPVSGSVSIYQNGIRLVPGLDFTVNGGNLTLLVPHLGQPGDYFLVDYDHQQ